MHTINYFLTLSKKNAYPNGYAFIFIFELFIIKR